jgi:hypothetical protein
MVAGIIDGLELRFGSPGLEREKTRPGRNLLGGQIDRSGEFDHVRRIDYG